MPDISFTLPNGLRGTMGEDGKISLLGKAPTPDQRPSALSGPGATDPDEPSPLAKPAGRVIRGIDAGTNPIPEAASISAPPQPDFGADATPLIKEDPIGDTMIGGAVAKPIGALVGGALGKAAPIVRRIVQPSLKGAVEGAAISGIPTLVRTGSPLEAAKAAGEGALVGGVLGHAAHSVGGIVGKALREKAARATEEAASATEAAHAAEAGAPVGGISDQPHPALTPTVHEHLTTLAGSAGPAGIEALKAVALRPTLETLQAAVKAGVPAYIALQVARLGHSGVVAP